MPPMLRQAVDFLQEQPYTYEILVVENGSTDQTSAVVEAFIMQELYTKEECMVQLLHSTPGKGAAVKKGMLAATGQYRFFCDADFAMPVTEVPKFLPPAVDDESSVIIGSRELPDSVRYDEPFYRHLMGRVFNTLVRWVAVPKIQDTQCGFKCFTKEAAEVIFPLQQVDGWGFDVELLYIANLYNFQIVEIPIHWYHDNDSRVRPIQDTFNMVRDLLKIRQNARRSVYKK